MTVREELQPLIDKYGVEEVAKVLELALRREALRVAGEKYAAAMSNPVFEHARAAFIPMQKHTAENVEIERRRN